MPAPAAEDRASPKMQREDEVQGGLLFYLSERKAYLAFWLS